MLDALADVLFVFIVGKCRADIAYRMEIVCLHIGLVHRLEDAVDIRGVTQRHYFQHVVVMVEHNHHLI